MNKEGKMFAVAVIMAVAALSLSAVLMDCGEEVDGVPVYGADEVGTQYIHYMDSIGREVIYESAMFFDGYEYYFTPKLPFGATMYGSTVPFKYLCGNQDGSGERFAVGTTYYVSSSYPDLWVIYDDDASYTSVTNGATYTYQVGDTIALNKGMVTGGSYSIIGCPEWISKFGSGAVAAICGTATTAGIWEITFKATGPDVSVSTTFTLVVEEHLSSTVSFSSNGSIINTQTVDNGSTATAWNPVMDGYTFKGWYTDNTFSTPFDFSTAITQDITLFAKWEGNFAFTSEPTAEGTVTPVATMANTVLFNAEGSEGSLIVWDFGDGTTATGMYQTHYYAQPGTYTVKLLVYNDDGDVDMKEYPVIISAQTAEGGGDLMSVTSSSWSYASSEVVLSSDRSSDPITTAGGVA